MSSIAQFSSEQMNVQDLILALQRLVKKDPEIAYLPVFTVEFGSFVPCRVVEHIQSAQQSVVIASHK